MATEHIPLAISLDYSPQKSSVYLGIYFDLVVYGNNTRR